MIFFKPETISDNIIKFTALEDEKECGYCLMKTERSIADVYTLEFDEDRPYLVEGLLRTAFNSAALSNIYMGKCTCCNIDMFLERMNFEKKDDFYINDIPSILTGSCCK